jgi:polyhydroxyalkanoate synthase subunit PhaC
MMNKEQGRQAEQAETVSDEAARHTLALNPLVGLRSQDLIDGTATVLRAIINEPTIAARQWLWFMGELGKIATGQSERSPAAGDKRFADPTWKNSKVHQGLLQAYLAWGSAVDSFVSQSSLSELDKTRAHLITTILIDALAPTNALLTNPAALKQLVDTGGESLWRGLKNYFEDLVQNGGLPSQVKKSAFRVGKNLACSPGAVVFRNPLVELIQYTPTTANVRKRPLVITPPQINKYYAMDLSPDKSLVQFLLGSGIQTFCISWRNPTAEQRDWGLDTYVAALDEAVDAVREITATDDVTMMGSCSGGITTSAYLGSLAGRNEPKIKSVVLAVCILDTATTGDSAFGSLITPETMRAAKEASRLSGVLDGDDLARMFAWMRPNDLIWNYWVNNYLLGKEPPAFDILFWNADTTRLPARLHADYLDLYFTNPFVNSRKLSLNGTAIDMNRVKVDSYVIAGVTDHITPWKSVYQTAKIMGKDTTFILSNSGHLQSLLNPPGNPKASFVAGPFDQAGPDAFLTGGKKHEGSWWLHWRDWLYERSDDEVPAPTALGNHRHRAQAPAPGTYVFDQ